MKNFLHFNNIAPQPSVVVSVEHEGSVARVLFRRDNKRDVLIATRETERLLFVVAQEIEAMKSHVYVFACFVFGVVLLDISLDFMSASALNSLTWYQMVRAFCAFG